MASHHHHRYYRGILLPRIAHGIGVRGVHIKDACSLLHDAFRDYLCVESTADLSDHEFLSYMSAILMLMARERGMLVPFYNEPDHIEEMTMIEWLALQKIIDK